MLAAFHLWESPAVMHTVCLFMFLRGKKEHSHHLFCAFFDEMVENDCRGKKR